MAISATDATAQPDTHSEDKEIDLREYIGVVLEGWPWILALALLGLIAASYLAWKTAPVYQATSLMRVEQGQNMAPQAFMEQQINSGGNIKAVSAEATVLQSRSVVGDAVDDLHLRVRAKPSYFPVIGEPIARFVTANMTGTLNVPFFGRYAWGNESVNVSRMQLPDNIQAAKFSLVAGENGAYRLLDDQGQPVLDGQVGSTASGTLPGGAAIKLFVASLKAKPGTYFDVSYVPKPAAIAGVQSRIHIEERPAGSGLLSLRYTGSSPAEAQRQLDAIMAAYLQMNVEKQSEQAQRRLEFLKEQLPEIRAERDAAEKKLRDYQTESGTLDLSAEAQSILQRMTNIDQQVAQTELERQELLQEFTNRAPQVQAANDKRASLVQQRKELEAQLKKLPKAESKLLEFRRDVEVNDVLYTQLLNTSQGLEISKAGITGVTHIVDAAYAPSGKVAPKRVVWALMGIALGIVMAILLSILRAALRATLDNPEDIESRFGLPVYATVPFSAKAAKKQRRNSFQLLATQEPDEPAVESIRSLRTSLQFAMLEGDTKFIAITGPTPGCGKSFISSNTAALIADTGKRVLLIDADMRRGQLARSLDLQRRPGFSEVLAGEKNAFDVIQQTPVSNMDFMSAGNRPPNPAELLIAKNFEVLKTDVAARYDYVIYDLPPVLNVTDASIVARKVAATFLVVRSEHSSGSEVEQAIRRLQRDGIKVAGAIFNGLKVNRLRYGRGRYSHYSYRY
ncbi:polysaccharide biosynthesis tyrosine autokinase [Salinisphaera sp. T31B1]|uniref:polysaccharide biosynthesis tyrosine autokinase n=1 Tax=Salinisphaera sp. T31B1 TaxID=727963 RepID=UPI00333F3EFE